MNLEAFFKLTYGLYVVGASNNGKLNGYVANALTQITAEPPQVVVCCHKNNFTTEFIQIGKAFSISVLAQDADSEIIGAFGFNSGRNLNKFENFDYKIGSTGSPILTQDCVAWFECELVESIDVGTHFMFIGKVIDNELLENDKDALTYKYYREKKKGFSPKNSPTYIDKSKIAGYEEKKENKGTYECDVCHYLYDPAAGDEGSGIKAGTSFEELPEDWVCPICGAGKDDFSKLD